MAGTPLRVGIFGGGIVGGGTYELVQRCTASGRFAEIGASIEVVKICVRDLKKPRDFEVKAGQTELVTDYGAILNDPSINCVVEVMGGTTHAKDVVFGAIAAGKHVVTANKALIAAYLVEIQQLLQANPSVQFLYEAAVCGGIPIIHALHTDFLADRITKVRAREVRVSKLVKPHLTHPCTLAAAIDHGHHERDDQLHAVQDGGRGLGLRRGPQGACTLHVVPFTLKTHPTP